MKPSHSGRKKPRGLVCFLNSVLVIAIFIYSINFIYLTAYAANQSTVEEFWTPASRLLPAGEKEQRTISNSSYAYAWVIGSIHEDRPAYKGFLYDVLISANVLRKHGSKADFWVWVEMSPNSTLDEMPQEDLRLIKALGIHVRHLEKPSMESFARLVYDKFRTLQMTDYKRVMFLDADIIPLVNLDYLFHLSDPDESSLPTVLRPNLIMASRGEPCNTGMFIVEPKPGAWDRLQAVIEKQRESARKLPYPHFSRSDGWEAIDKKNNKWNFHASHSDQGLMYYYTKYMTQDVSIAISDRLQNWMPSDGQLPQKVSEVKGELAKYSPKPAAYQHFCDAEPNSASMYCYPPYRDVCHFMGSNKPWQLGVGVKFMKNTNTHGKSAPYRLWFKELTEINEKYDMGLDIKNFDTVHLKKMKESPLGYMAMYTDHTKELFRGVDENTTTH
jgi:hypothetical protein